ncbi:MAG: hypothetical protein IJ537_11085 [Bacteroidaceae bacterium]|nr:hypothetical protein [Bacteroidaceae bacterium]
MLIFIAVGLQFRRNSSALQQFGGHFLAVDYPFLHCEWRTRHGASRHCSVDTSSFFDGHPNIFRWSFAHFCIANGGRATARPYIVRQSHRRFSPFNPTFFAGHFLILNLFILNFELNIVSLQTE